MAGCDGRLAAGRDIWNTLTQLPSVNHGCIFPSGERIHYLPSMFFVQHQPGFFWLSLSCIFGDYAFFLSFFLVFHKDMLFPRGWMWQMDAKKDFSRRGERAGLSLVFRWQVSWSRAEGAADSWSSRCQSARLKTSKSAYFFGLGSDVMSGVILPNYLFHLSLSARPPGPLQRRYSGNCYRFICN